MEFLDSSVKLPFTSRLVTVRHAFIHAGYWLLVTGFFIHEENYLIAKAGIPYYIAGVAVTVGLLMIVAYLNLHYFLPRYLLRKHYVKYALAVLLCLAGTLFVLNVFDYYLYEHVITPVHQTDRRGILLYGFSRLWYLCLMFALKFSIDWYHRQVTIQEITLEKLNAELGLLRSQVNPGFLFNVLNNLYALTLKRSPLAPDIVLKLSQMMEYMLYDSTDCQVSLDKELLYLQNYIALERLRLSNESNISVEVIGSAEGAVIAPLLLMPLVENGLKHGPGRHGAEAWLRIDIGVNHSSITVSVENGKRDRESRAVKAGIGLMNLRKRLELSYPGKHQLRLDDQPDRFLAILIIQL